MLLLFQATVGCKRIATVPYSGLAIQQYPIHLPITKDSSGLSRTVKGMMACRGTSTFRTTPVTTRIYQLFPYKLHMDSQT